MPVIDGGSGQPRLIDKALKGYDFALWHVRFGSKPDITL
jgi:hypothetical protein